jgi:AcrR family transcriptional regulator
MKKNAATDSVETSMRIKKAAKHIFLTKGYGRSRTREIALLAKTNPALVNYYFRSKENLFEIVMLEMMSEFMQNIAVVINEKSSTFENKIEALVNCYSELGRSNPSLPMFVLNEMHKGHKGVSANAGKLRTLLKNSVMAKQLQERVASGKYQKATIAHVMMNLLGLTIFPSLAAPLIQAIGGLKEEQYRTLQTERQKNIAEWVIQSLK